MEVSVELKPVRRNDNPENAWLDTPEYVDKWDKMTGKWIVPCTSPSGKEYKVHQLIPGVCLNPAGRPKGKNTGTNVTERLTAMDFDVIEEIVTLLRSGKLNASKTADTLVKLLPYIAPTLQSITVDSTKTITKIEMSVTANPKQQLNDQSIIDASAL